jgi:tRNA pseudouridine32 synthase/23S rRNA pseudouridine746 synthase
VIHNFPEHISFQEPCALANPFRYSPHLAVKEAARLVTNHIDEDAALRADFAEGKMLGVMVVKHRPTNTLGYIAAFSGNVGGKSHIEGFVPPVFDLLDPDGEFKRKEAEITEINKAVQALSQSSQMERLKMELAEAERNRDIEIESARVRMTDSKKQREEMRRGCSDDAVLAALTRESQFEKAELKRLKSAWEERISVIRHSLEELTDELDQMKARRAVMSEKLQDWIFRQYIVHNSMGEASTIAEIFEQKGLTPPGGTGECAAPKLLEYAYRNDLEPLAMGEFWYGCSPQTAVRTHGHFYPSCTSKCGPLLGYMLGDMKFPLDIISGNQEIIYEDSDIVAVAKPSGMPSVPGLDCRLSLEEFLNDRSGPVYPVHRLDMDTSGVILFAKSEMAAASLRCQFQNHTVKKTYHARLGSATEGMKLQISDTGTIRLPLSADYDERPRQKVDIPQGKEAITGYEVADILPDGSIEIIFHPHTGRTHQLRVHSAHLLGLGHPIVGDMLYGGDKAERLCLHAFSICFTHPSTGAPMTITSQINHYR